MIEIKNKQIHINGKPEIIMCGEIHYYRLNRDEWQDRLDKLKASGCNAVASYVPWLCHEPVEGEVDLEGKTRPELDLCGFIDLCQENGLYFFIRPGPFIMAEMKNEGLPHWVSEKHPEIVPVSWDGEPVKTATIDYLAPAFLAESRKWYRAIMEIVEPRLHANGGNIIGFQLDNEIGMLSWVSNNPDLTYNVISDFVQWLKETYGSETLVTRYSFNLENKEEYNKAIRSPEETYAAELLHDLGYFMRNRFARYVSELRAYAEEFGAKDIPFIVNIHGTSDGRAFTYPIGISQLYESYTQDEGYLSGSDIYFGDLSMDTFQDLYIINGFMDAVHNPDQPLTSVEFNCGDGNFGSTYGGRYDPSAADFKTRMCIAQGNRLINYYLFSGGRNYRLDEIRNDGNDRIAHTGERHGFAAPVSPEGELNYTFPRMSRAIQTAMAVSDKVAVMDEERDDVAFAFIPDYFMTESRYPKSHKMNEILAGIEANRAGGAWEIMGRAMLLNGYRFSSVDIQNKPIDPAETPVLALGSAPYMASEIQQKLAEYLRAGGGLLLYGQVPIYDMEGHPCLILADELGVKPIGVHHASQDFHLSLVADGWAVPRPEVRTHYAQVFEVSEAEPILRVYGTDEICGFDAKVSKGRAIVMATAYDCDLPLFKIALEKLGAKAALNHDCYYHGLFMTTTANSDGERFLHILNLDGFDKEFHVYERGQILFEGRKITLQNKDGVMLPLNVSFNDKEVSYSTAEIRKVKDDCLVFRLTQSEDVIAIDTEREVIPSADYVVEKKGNTTLITSRKHAKIDDNLIVRFA